MRDNGFAVGESGEASPAVTLDTIAMRSAASGSAGASPLVISTRRVVGAPVAVAAPAGPQVPKLQIPNSANPLPGTIYSPVAGAKDVAQPESGVQQNPVAVNPQLAIEVAPNTGQRNANAIAEMMRRDIPGLEGMQATYREGAASKQESNTGLFGCCPGRSASPPQSSRTVLGDEKNLFPPAQSRMEREPTPFPKDAVPLDAAAAAPLSQLSFARITRSGTGGPARNPAVLAAIQRLKAEQKKAQSCVSCDDGCENCCNSCCCNSAPIGPTAK